MERVDRVVDVRVGQPRVAADPERALGHRVGDRERPDHTVLDVLIRRLAKQVAREQLTSGDTARLELVAQFVARDRRILAQADRKAEPGRARAGRRLGQHQHVLQAGEALSQPAVVVGAARDKAVETLELDGADGGLEVGRLEVVADLRVDVLVVVAGRKRAVLLGEPLAAGVVAAGVAPAVPAPVADRLGHAPERGALHQDRAALPGGDLVGGIEGERREVAERPDRAPVVGPAEGVAAVLDQHQLVAAAERLDGLEIERVAQRVGDHDRARARREGVLQLVDVDVVARQLDVDEHGHEAVLHDRIDRRGKAGRDRDHLVARTQPALPHAGGAQR